MRTFLLRIFIVILFISCSDNLEERKNYKKDFKEIEEIEVRYLPLDNFLSNPELEFSGLAWYKDKLILLPQYPAKVKDGNFIYIEKSEILKAIKTKSNLSAKFIKVDLTGLEAYESYGSGFEAIAVKEDTLFASIESVSFFETSSVTVKGYIDSVKLMIDFDEKNLLKIPSSSGISNFSEETLIIGENSIFAIHEYNSGENPKVYRIPFDLSGFEKVDFPQLNYRITDGTTLDSSSNCYLINYFWEGDDSDFPIKDLILEKWGIGKSNKLSNNIERLVEINISTDGIKLTEKPPIYLKLAEYGRNWEGIVKLESLGFLIISDKHPQSILGFIPLRKEN